MTTDAEVYAAWEAEKRAYHAYVMQTHEHPAQIKKGRLARTAWYAAYDRLRALAAPNEVRRVIQETVDANRTRTQRGRR